MLLGIAGNGSVGVGRGGRSRLVAKGSVPRRTSRWVVRSREVLEQAFRWDLKSWNGLTWLRSRKTVGERSFNRTRNKLLNSPAAVGLYWQRVPLSGIFGHWAGKLLSFVERLFLVSNICGTPFPPTFTSSWQVGQMWLTRARWVERGKQSVVFTRNANVTVFGWRPPLFPSRGRGNKKRLIFVVSVQRLPSFKTFVQCSCRSQVEQTPAKPHFSLSSCRSWKGRWPTAVLASARGLAFPAASSPGAARFCSARRRREPLPSVGRPWVSGVPCPGESPLLARRRARKLLSVAGFWWTVNASSARLPLAEAAWAPPARRLPQSGPGISSSSSATSRFL